MNCWHCNHKLTWGGDHDIDEETTFFGEYSMVTNLSCPECDSFVLVYLPKDTEESEDGWDDETSTQIKQTSRGFNRRVRTTAQQKDWVGHLLSAHF